MFFTLFVAALAAMIWALRSASLESGSSDVPHDPSTLELTAMATITLAAYVWMKRLHAIRRQSAASQGVVAPTVPERYEEAAAEAVLEETRETAEHAA